MAFDLEKHLKNHAEYFKKFKEINPKSMHFNFSFLDLQFIGKDKKQVMVDLLEELKKPTSYRVANGWKNGKQVFANRAIDLHNSTEIEAIHFKDPEDNDTMPHIHLMISDKTRLGKNYSLLKKHISTISEKFGVSPNFDELTEHNPMSVKNLSKAVSSLTWSWKKMSNDELRKDINTRGIDNAISILSAYAIKTNNLTYYIKSLEGLKARLNRLKLDVEYQGHNLRNTYPLPLKEVDLKVIKLIVEKRFNQKDMKPHLKNPILRDFIRHSAGTSKPYIITSLKEMTHLLEDGVYKNQKAVENYLKLLSRIPPQVKKSQLTKEQNRELSSKSNLSMDLKLAAQSSTNEKELRALMQEAGYQGFGFKKQKGSIKGCFYLEDEKKQVFKFDDININWSNIKRALMENHQNKENGQEIQKKEPLKRNLKPLDGTTHPMLLTKTPKAIKIDYKHEEVEKSKNQNKEKSKMRRMADELIQKFRNGIQKFKAGIQRIKRKITRFEEAIKSIQSHIKRENSSLSSLEYEINEGQKEIKRDQSEIERIELQLEASGERGNARYTRNKGLRAESRELETKSKKLENIAIINKYGEEKIIIMTEVINEENDSLDYYLKTYFSIEKPSLENLHKLTPEDTEMLVNKLKRDDEIDGKPWWKIDKNTSAINKLNNYLNKKDGVLLIDTLLKETIEKNTKLRENQHLPPAPKM